MFLLSGLNSKIKAKQKKPALPGLLKTGRTALFAVALGVINISYSIVGDKNDLSKPSSSDLYEIPENLHLFDGLFDGNETSGLFFLIENGREKCGIPPNLLLNREISARRSLIPLSRIEQQFLSVRDRREQAQKTLINKDQEEQPVGDDLVSHNFTSPGFSSFDFDEEYPLIDGILLQDFFSTGLFLSRPFPFSDTDEKTSLHWRTLNICPDQILKTVLSTKPSRDKYAGLPAVISITTLMYVSVCLFTYSINNEYLTVTCDPFWKVITLIH